MGISRDHWHKRRATGGKRPQPRKKRKFELGRPASNTKLGVKRIHTVRTRGGNKKYRALRLDTGNFSWGSESIARKTRIIDVVYNPSNNELVRTKTLTKSTVVQIDATPFRQWYEAHYALPLGRRKNIKMTAEDEANLNKKRSKKTMQKYLQRQKTAKVDPKLDDLFASGRLFALVSSRPGKHGRAAEFKAILFALCYFHAVVAERRKFGSQGWNRNYPFNNGDLTISVNVLYNYLEANSKVPWENLRYLFGEIMYGGHITDDWDRRLCRTYLEEYMNPQMFDGELNLAPGFPIPPSSDYKGYHLYIDENIPPESPYLYGLHPNAEIDFLTTTSENLFRTVLEMQPRDIGAGAGGEGGQTRDEKIKQKLDEILEKLPDEFPVRELMAKAEEKTPYTVVALQECERMNILTREIRRSLKELNLGLKGELTITTEMESLQDALYLDQIPGGWMKRAYPSMYPLGQWYADLLQRIKELEIWTGDFQLPAAVWLGGLFNPQSFLTAIMQTTARKNEWPLDKMCLSVDVTKKAREELGGAPREGAYVHGLFMEGARWDTQTGQIADAKLKDLTPQMPVIFIKAIPVDRRETKNIYECPVYKTKSRGPTFVWTFNLKTKEKAAKWVLGGVALLLQV